MLNIFSPIVSAIAGNTLSEINVATVQQGNIANDSIGVLQGNISVIGQTTGDGVDFF